ncbi:MULTISPECIES: helix-turn-helix domain-containing protein [Metabacillus]|uniref:Helix-turn-helix domain-containing protein n=1 Tax=Metabacillus hrfriensis TaxID=3048891 RepID=A0ACD4R9J9_9BACI|nr:MULTISPECIES: helix-turn-helix domain-containing protein [Metabacillus]UAL51299.1 helix-turn-helix domain-containing protein [Metabacillus dongyingensis]USK27597.1 helix-turn-helix domain-containing protein [Bacillus sp. CMF21]WHZ56807.1 helix-turn-helix domain-containing protein [Metabacillus sp. CT-WN-B3]
MIAGTKLRQLREERSIPLGLLAKYLNISVRILISIERNKKNLTADQIAKVCELFEINKSDLL